MREPESFSDDATVLHVAFLRSKGIAEAEIAASLLMAACSVATTSLNDVTFIADLETCANLLRRQLGHRRDN